MITRVTILALLLLAAAAAPAAAATGSDYVASRLTRLGGFAEAGTATPSVGLTEWSVMGLAAAGRRPGLMHRTGGSTPAAFLARRAGGWRDAYSLARGILAAVAMGRSPYSFGGRNLVAALRAGVRWSSGRIGSYANSTYWGVLALHAAGSPLPPRSLAYIRARQQASGGYGWAAGAAPDSNDTAAAIMALRAGGTPCSWGAVSGGIAFVRSLQNPDGGYGLTAVAGSDSQSTAWVVEARLTCALQNSGALSYLAARRTPSGAYNYQSGRPLTPVWVTAQVLPAVNGRAYPIRP